MSGVVSVVIGAASLLMGLPIVFTIMVVNFVGGYIPYIGAFLGGGLAVIVALGDGGVAQAALMLLIVLAANLLLENFVEPKVMGSSLDVHPLVVLVVTALGGLVGGMVGLILAVPAYVIARDGLARLRSRGDLDRVERSCAARRAEAPGVAARWPTPAPRAPSPELGRPDAPPAEPGWSGRRQPPWRSRGRCCSGCTTSCRSTTAPPRESVARLIVGIVGFIVVLGIGLHRVKNPELPMLRAIQALGVAIAVFLVVFTALYRSISQASTSSFSEPLNHTGGLYLTITVFSTVGFGDITPETDLARILVSVQMLLDLVVIGAVVRLLLNAAKTGMDGDM